MYFEMLTNAMLCGFYGLLHKIYVQLLHIARDINKFPNLYCFFFHLNCY